MLRWKVDRDYPFYVGEVEEYMDIFKKKCNDFFYPVSGTDWSAWNNFIHCREVGETNA